MKQFSTTLLALLAALVLMAPAAYSQTADGQTPADETVCDPLKSDGVTKGLYGLCVAFCEAQDFADASVAISDDDLAALADGAPSGKILANYNKKKTEADPPMPCIKVEEPCPCWTAEELASIDGVNSQGVLFDTRECTDRYADPNFVFNGVYGVTRSNHHEFENLFAGPSPSGPGNGLCIGNFRNELGSNFVFLTVQEGTLTPAEADTCYEQLRSHIQTYPCDTIFTP